MTPGPEQIWFSQENIDLYSNVKLHVLGLVTHGHLIKHRQIAKPAYLTYVLWMQVCQKSAPDSPDQRRSENFDPVEKRQISTHGPVKNAQIIWADASQPRFMGPTWGPPGSCRTQMGPMLAPWTLLLEMHPKELKILSQQNKSHQNSAHVKCHILYASHHYMR